MFLLAIQTKTLRKHPQSQRQWKTRPCKLCKYLILTFGHFFRRMSGGQPSNQQQVNIVKSASGRWTLDRQIFAITVEIVGWLEYRCHCPFQMECDETVLVSCWFKNDWDNNQRTLWSCGRCNSTGSSRSSSQSPLLSPSPYLFGKLEGWAPFLDISIQAICMNDKHIWHGSQYAWTNLFSAKSQSSGQNEIGVQSASGQELKRWNSFKFNGIQTMKTQITFNTK